MRQALVTLKKGEGRLLKSGGAWIFDNEIDSIMGEFENGDIVIVHDFDGYGMGRGFINMNSKIRIRMMTRKQDQEIDHAFLEMRVRDAWEYRKKTVDTSSCRVIFGEADFLPGLVIDKFSDVLVVESLALGIDRMKEEIVDILKAVLSEDGITIRGVYERSDAKVRQNEGMERVKGFIGEEFDTKVEIVENDLSIGGKDGLTPIEKTIIDRCTRLVYRDYLQDPRPENMPILGDLYELLRKQSEPEAQNIATALEIYVNGSLNVFNHRSNIDMDSHRVLCFQLKSLGKALKEIGLLIMQDAVWNRVTANREKHKTTWFYIDEFHLLLKGQTGAFSVEIWKRFRKWGGIPSGLTQNVKDLLASREIENIFENSDFIYMLNQAQGDRQILAKQLGISPTQLSYVTHSGPGEGLLFFGNVIIPFVDHFPKDTSLYQIMTTRPEEVAEAGT